MAPATTTKRSERKGKVCRLPMSTVPATMPMSPTPSATSPTISSESRSSRLMLTCGCSARKRLKASGRNSVRALVLASSRTSPDSPPAKAPRSSRSRAVWERMVRACLSRVRPAGVGVTPWRERSSSGAPRASSMLRMRVEAAASARAQRSAPRVIEPASVTSQNSRRSVRSNRILRLPRRMITGKTHCITGKSAETSALAKGRSQLKTLGSDCAFVDTRRRRLKSGAASSSLERP